MYKRQDQRLDQATFHLFTLLYRGLLKLNPEYAGFRYPTLCRLAHESRGRDAKGIWLALCCEYGVLLGANRKWRWRFAQELTSIGGDEKRRYRERSNSELNTLFRRGLEHLDHLEQDLYPPQSTSVYRGLKVTSKLEDSARRQVYSDPEPERPYRSESTPGSLDPKICLLYTSDAADE